MRVLSFSDYYPFGEQLPDRNSNSGNYRYAFQGQELDGETNMEAFQLRLWDGRIGRWLSPDPMGQYASPYLGMGNNPIGLIDPDGGSANPVYGSKGEGLLGTTESGLQGEAIVMDAKNFKQNMSDADALRLGTLFSNFSGSASLMKSIQSDFSQLSKRPDWDGIVTSEEARKWWNSKNGGDLYIDISKLGLSPLSTGSFDGNKMLRFNFFGAPDSNYRTAVVHGTLSMRLKNPLTGEVGLFTDKKGYFDTYDFNSDGRISRDISTWIARRIVGEGTGFGFKPYGKNPTVQINNLKY